MLTIITSSGDKIEHERARNSKGQPIERCVTCNVRWPCLLVVDVQDAADAFFTRQRGAA